MFTGVWKKAALAAGVALLVLALFFSPLSDVFDDLDGERVAGWVDAAGAWGPLIVITLMTVAIVATPIPSAPIAMAAGAAYGHVMGTVYVVVGAELGALIAFGLARVLGRDTLTKWLGDTVDAGLLGSQNALTGTVFASRLLPFVSFDIVSYAAGLSSLHVWRFALATLAGIIPASFVLAHFGNEAVSQQGDGTAWIAIGLGALTLLPLIVVGIRDWRKKNRAA